METFIQVNPLTAKTLSKEAGSAWDAIAQSIFWPAASGGITISPNDLLHAQSIESSALVQFNVLSPNDARNTQSIEAPSLTQSHTLTPAELRNLQSIESPPISLNPRFWLGPGLSIHPIYRTAISLT